MSAPRGANEANPGLVSAIETRISLTRRKPAECYTAATAFAQSPAPVPTLDAAASDPVKLGWMVGSPPPPEKTIQFADGTFRQFHQSRWAYSHMREFVPTAVVPRGETPISPLPAALRDDIDTLSFLPIGSDRPMIWAASLAANYTDGILVLHRGRIVYERYLGALVPDRRHILFSVTKSLVGTLTAALVAEGVLDERAPVSRYVPELGSSGLANATVRQVMDMTTGMKFNEDYANPAADIWAFARAASLLPRPADYRGPPNTYDYLATLQNEAPHGERFAYRTPNTSILAWILQRVTGQPIRELLRERIWSRLGVEQDAYFTIDSIGVEFTGGGLNTTLRDLARFGEMMRLEGRFNGQQIVLKAAIDDIRGGGDREQFARSVYKTALPGWSYRAMWWIHHNEHGAYSARGIHGQAIYIDPKAEMVIVRFGSHPRGSNLNYDATSLPAYHAVALHLLSHSR